MTYDAAAGAASGSVGLEAESGHDQSGHRDQFDLHAFHTAATHLDAAGADVIHVPDPELLFTGHFRHAGPDLVIAGDDGREILITDYFTGARSPVLVAPNGAALSPELVAMLARSPTHDHYVQTTAPTPADAIGKAEKVTGTVTVMRNGVSVALNAGDAVYKSDVIQTGANSSCGIDFPDGTALNLVANTRMAMSDWSYDPNGNSNVALFSLVEGTFAFVAGKVAHTGDMKVETPVATMGIRGTTGYVEQVATISATLGNVTYSFAVTEDYGTGRVGQYDLIDQNGNVIATVSQNGYITYVSPQGPNLPPLVSTQVMNTSELQFEQQIIQEVFQILNLGGQLGPNPNPQSNPGPPGSSTPPDELQNLQHLLQENTVPFTITVFQPASFGGGSVSGTVIITTQIAGIASNTYIWNASTGNWDTPSDWNPAALPGPNDIVEILPGEKLTINSAETIAGLIVEPRAIVNIVDPGVLTVTGEIANSGTLQINSSGEDPTLAISGTVDALNVAGDKGGKIDLMGVAADNNIVGVAGTGATLVNVNNTIEGSGTVGSGDKSLTLVNGGDGIIDATPLINGDSGVLTINTGNTVVNSGLIEATVTSYSDAPSKGGALIIDDAVNNQGIILANGTGATVEIDNVGTVNSGTIEAESGGIVTVTTALANNGILIADDGKIVIAGAVSGSGSATIEGGGSIELGGTDVQALKFDGAGSLVLENSSATAFAGTISGFGVGDTIVLADVSFVANQDSVTWDQATDTLTVHYGEQTESFKLSGSYVQQDFAIVSDGGEAEIVYVADEWIGPSSADRSGNWTIGSNWTLGVPTSSLSALIDLPGTYKVNVSGDQSANSLTISDVDATLTGSGKLTLETLINDGTIEAGRHERLTIIAREVDNSGLIEAGHRGEVSIDHAQVDNSHGGLIEADGQDSKITFDHGRIRNSGRIEAKFGGEVSFDDSGIDNTRHSEITANGRGSEIKFNRNRIDNWGSIAANWGGLVLIDRSRIDNDRHGDIAADGRGSEVKFDHDGIDNSGLIAATRRGEVSLDHSQVGNSRHGDIEAEGRRSEIRFDHDRVDNSGRIDAKFGGEVAFDHSHIDNGRHGEIEAEGWGSKVKFDHDHVDNSGQIVAEHHGEVAFVDSRIDNSRHGRIEADGCGSEVRFDGDRVDNDGRIEAKHGGTVEIDRSTIENWGGTVAAYGWNSTVNLDDATINGGVLRTADGGVIQTTLAGWQEFTNTTFDDVTIACGTDVQINDNTSLTLKGTIDNDGTVYIGIAQVVGEPDLIIDGKVTLNGIGSVVLNGDGDNILGDASEHAHNELINNETISGSGEIGGNGINLTLTNESGALIEATTGTLTIDTGHTVTNTGTLEANGGTLIIDDNVNNSGFGNWSLDSLTPQFDFSEHQSGSIVVDAGSAITIDGSVLGGSATIYGGTLTLSSAYDLTVNFSGTGGTLALDGTGFAFVDDSVSGFMAGDAIDLADINYSHAHLSHVGDTLIVSDGFFGPTVAITIDGASASDFELVQDGQGTDVIFDPPPAITGTEITADMSEAGTLSNGHPIVSGSVSGVITFEDSNSENTFTASASPEGGHYAGTFAVNSVNASGGTDTVDWSFDFSNVKLSSGQTLTQSYDVNVADQYGAATTQQISISVGGAGNDTFVFAPGIGADTIVNFDSNNDTISLQNFSGVHSVSDLTFTKDANGNAVIELGHGDSITVPGATDIELQSAVHISQHHNLI
jgi:hypothetical protein